MFENTTEAVGVDISKAHLDAHRFPSGEAARFENDAAGIGRLAAWIGPDAKRVVYESTGPWHRALEEALAGELDELQSARDALIKDRTAALNRQKQARHTLVKRYNKARLAQIGRQIKGLDAQIGTLIGADKALSRKVEVLTSIPGVGPITAAGLVSQLPELGEIHGKAIASLAGL